MQVVIIGSGLAAVAVAKRLADQDIKPTILDVGEELETHRASLAKQLSESEPTQWSNDDRRTLTSNPTIHQGMAIPKKLLFGSDFFYGRPQKYASVEGVGPLPPFTYAKGGFSVGWGAAVLPPDQCDLDDWPIDIDDLEDHFRYVLSSLPLSAADDELTDVFPLYKDDYIPLDMTLGNKALLHDLRKSRLLESNRCLFGQARLLVRAQDAGDKLGCKYCGYCMSGCVYGSIYKALDDVNDLISSGRVIYTGGALVQRLEEQENRVRIIYIDCSGKSRTLHADKVFVAAGAVNSTRIIMSSKKLFDHTVRLHTRGGFVVPILKAKHIPVDWPNVNTQPGLFLEYKVPGLPDHWVHTQLSTPNEMIFEKLNIDSEAYGPFQKLKHRLIGHLLIAFGNLHSAHAFGYELTLKQPRDTHQDTLLYTREDRTQSNKETRLAIRQLGRLMRKIGCLTLSPIARFNTGSYHVGGTLPMKKKPVKETETDLLGRPLHLNHIHVVDSSIFPSLPGTTIGLLSMANADRIASAVLSK